MTETASQQLSQAEALRKVREDLGLTQEQWAARLGVSSRTVSRWEQGVSEPGSAAQKATIASNAGGALPRELAPWAALASAVALGSALGPVGAFLGASVATGAAATAMGWLGSRNRNDPRAQPVFSGFKTQAATLGVPWKPFRDGLVEALKVAKDSGLGIDDVILLLSIKE